METQRYAGDGDALLYTIDAEIRKCGDQIGFDTLVVRTVNSDYQVLGCNVSELKLTR